MSLPLRQISRALKRAVFILLAIGIVCILVYVTNKRPHALHDKELDRDAKQNPFAQEREQLILNLKVEKKIILDDQNLDKGVHSKLSWNSKSNDNANVEQSIGHVGRPINEMKMASKVARKFNRGFEKVNDRLIAQPNNFGLNSHGQTIEDSKNILSCSNVHIFYYPWYGNPATDGQYLHWNHKVLPHWDKEIDKNFEKTSHQPPNDIASNFYPELGAYSSKDPKIITDHFKQISEAGIGVVVVSYYPPGSGDDSGKSWDEIYPTLLDKASEFDLKITFHIEPYKKRNAATVRDDITHIIDNYGHHKGFYRYEVNDNVQVPFFYIYDSYLTKPEDWASVLKPDGSNTIRGTKYDSMMIGLLVDVQHSSYVSIGGFDGIYTYFASNGFTYGSSRNNWKDISARSAEMDFLFIPSVGPGYIDTNIRPWNSENTRDRSHGEYYKNSWKSALEVSPKIVSVTSFNEWHEGTQIERAIPKLNLHKYLDYKPFQPDFYLKLTKSFINQFRFCKNS